MKRRAVVFLALALLAPTIAAEAQQERGHRT
jgi:hypothetical protein